jgi:hypothetical protein
MCFTPRRSQVRALYRPLNLSQQFGTLVDNGSSHRNIVRAKLNEQAKELSISSCERWIALMLRLVGISALMAIPAVVMPNSWILGIHRWLGLGEFPAEPIALYLARSLSGMYALHGALFLCFSFDVQRYLPVIRILAISMLVMGIALVVIDVTSELPVWWIFLEGPFAITFGLLLIGLLRKAKPA